MIEINNVELGPNGCGPNILVNEIASYQERSNYWSEAKENLKQLDQQLLSGFQLATQSGPLCEEPMAGVGFRLLEWEVFEDREDFNLTVTSGQLISTMKEACRKVYLTSHKRLLAAMYQCSIQVSLIQKFPTCGKRSALVGVFLFTIHL